MTNPNVVPFLKQPFLYINEMKISNNATTPNSKFDVSAGICRDQTDTYDLELGNYDNFDNGQTANSVTTCNALVNGLNGLDTGAVAASKVYLVYVINDPVSANLPGVMISLALPTVGPLMPFGYSAYRHIGYMVTDGSKNFLLAYNAGNNNARIFMYDAPISVGTTSTSASYANVDLTKFVPLVNNIPVYINASISGTAGDTLSLQPGNATGDAVVIEAQVNSQAVKQQVLVLAQTVSLTGVPSPVVNYKNSGTDTIALLVGGFQYYI